MQRRKLICDKRDIFGQNETQNINLPTPNHYRLNSTSNIQSATVLNQQSLHCTAIEMMCSVATEIYFVEINTKYKSSETESDQHRCIELP